MRVLVSGVPGVNFGLIDILLDIESFNDLSMINSLINSLIHYVCIYFLISINVFSKEGRENYVSLSVEPDQVWREVRAAHGATGNE